MIPVNPSGGTGLVKVGMKTLWVSDETGSGAKLREDKNPGSVGGYGSVAGDVKTGAAAVGSTGSSAAGTAGTSGSTTAASGSTTGTSAVAGKT